MFTQHIKLFTLLEYLESNLRAIFYKTDLSFLQPENGSFEVEWRGAIFDQTRIIHHEFC